MESSTFTNKKTLAQDCLWKLGDTEYPQDLRVAIGSLTEASRHAPYTEEEERSISGWSRPWVEDSAKDQCQREGFCRSEMPNQYQFNRPL